MKFFFLCFNIFFIILSGCLFSSCTLFQKFIDPSPQMVNVDEFKYYTVEDYVDQLVYLGEKFLSSPITERVYLDKNNMNYLNGIAKKMVDNNELLLANNSEVKFFILKDKRPFYFSIPNGSLFISLGLIQNYIRNEGDLISIIAVELIKSYRKIYYPRVVVPIESISIDGLLNLVKIDITERIELNQWAFYVIKRSGYDPYSYLTWIQQVNKNSRVFSMLFRDGRDIAIEEYYLKNFILSKKFSKKMQENSSQAFYTFIHDMEKIEL